MPITTTPQNMPNIFDHQKTAFKQLMEAGSVCFSSQRAIFPMQPRTNSLLIGPSGSGKTFLARAVAESLGVECKALTVAEWMLIGSGSKGAQRTWNSIFDFLLDNQSKTGAVIFLDEIDKLTGTSDWEQNLRVEVFRLLDLSLPPDLIDRDDDKYAATSFKNVERFLKHRTFIIAAGAFQSIYDNGSKNICGFGGEVQSEAPTLELLCRHLPRELVNRFRRSVVALPELKMSDYESMLLSAAEKMPPQFQERFLSLGEKVICEACRNKQGVRFLEELVADLLAQESAQETNPPPSQAPNVSRWRPDAEVPLALRSGDVTQRPF